MVRMMVLRSAFVLGSALCTIREEANNYWCRETGGPLVGYVSDDDAVVVTHAGGPGKKGLRKPFSVTFDGESAQRFCDAMRRRCEGLVDYVGDWHSHIRRSVRYSPSDVSALLTMAAFEHSPTRNPISLIYGRWTREIAVYALNDDGCMELLSQRIIDSIPGFLS